jgi:hypothetical protein
MRGGQREGGFMQIAGVSHPRASWQAKPLPPWDIFEKKKPKYGDQ